jgi:general secretion pathway protein J
MIEFLVAVAIFAVLSALAYGALNQTLFASEMMRERMDRLKSLQRTMRVVGDDFLQLAPRPVRNELGEGFRPALSTDLQSIYALELTRGGWTNVLVLPRGTLQRVAYRLEEGEFIRYHWNVLDRTLANEPQSEVLLTDVDDFAFRFLLPSGDWIERWPPPGTDGSLRQRPRAVQFVLDSATEGELSRIFEVAP